MTTPKTTTNDFKKCTQQSFLSDIEETNINKGRFCFILGSGASRESGIKTGREMQKEWLEKIKEAAKASKKDAKSFIKDKISEINENLEPLKKIELDVDELLKDGYSYPSEDYFPLFNIRFFPNEKNGYRYLENELEKSKTSFGYYPLARILTETPNNVVVSLNFDSLVEDSIFIYTEKKPLVVVHESLVKNIDLNQKRPIIAKIHRGLYFSPLNSSEDTSCLKDEWKESLKTIFDLYTPIIIGYGGGDASLMNFLQDTSPFKAGLYWCYMNEDDLSKEIKTIIKKHSGCGVKIAGFDDFMYHFGEVMGYNKGMPDNATKTLKEAAKTRSEDFENAFKKFDQKYKNKDSLTEAEKQTATLLDENEKTYEELLSKAIQDNPNNAENYFYRGNLYISQKEYEKALADYNKVIELDPSNEGVYNNRGIAYTELKLYDKALGDYKRVIELNPSYVSAYNNRGATYNKLEEYEKAIDDYTKAIELNPSDGNAYYNRGNTYSELKKYDKALDNYNKAIELNPNDADAYNNRSLTYQTLQEYKKALADVEVALKITQNDGEFYDTRAGIYNGLGEYDKAIEDCKKAIELNTTIPEAYENLAFALYKKGQFDEALKSCNKSIELDPSNDAAKKLLADINKAIKEHRP